MATIVFCGNCATEKGWPRPSVRTAEAACHLCGGWDAYRTRKFNPRTRQEEVATIKLKNFSHDAAFLIGTQQEARLQEPLV